MPNWKGHRPDILKNKQPVGHSANGSWYVTASENPNRRFEGGDRLIMDYKVWEIYEISRDFKWVEEGFARLKMRPLHDTLWASMDEDCVGYQCISDTPKGAAEEYVDSGYDDVEVGYTIFVWTKRIPYRVYPLAPDVLAALCEITADNDCWHEGAYEDLPTEKKVAEWYEKHKSAIKALEDSFNRELGIDRHFGLDGLREFQVAFLDPARVEDPKEAVKARFGVEG